MKNLFKRKKKLNVGNVSVRYFRSTEDSVTTYGEFPDGLRMIFREGRYVGWYLP